MPAFDKPDRLSLQVAALRLPPSRGDSMSTETTACCGTDWLSFRRIVFIPFDACVAALEGLLREGNHGEVHVGQSRLGGPIKHDRHSGTCRAEVRLARGPLRPVLRMRLNIDCWSPPPSSTALELIPCRGVRASASYFRAGHLLMDSLIHSLRLEREMQVLDGPAGEEPETGAVGSGSRSADSRDLPRPYALPGRSGELRVGGLYLSCMTRQSEESRKGLHIRPGNRSRDTTVASAGSLVPVRPSSTPAVLGTDRADIHRAQQNNLGAANVLFCR